MGKKKTTVESEPYKPAQPYIRDSLERAGELYTSGQSAIAPFDARQEEAFEGILGIARNPNYGGYEVANDVLGATAAGENLRGNPYLDDIITATGDDVSDRVNAIYSGFGRYGSGAHTDVMADSIGDVNARLRFANYDAERERQIQAASALPGLDQSLRGLLYDDQISIGKVGDAYQSLEAARLREPFDQLDRYAQLALSGGAAGGTQTQTSSGGLLGQVLGGLTTIGGIATGIPGTVGAVKGLFDSASYS